MCEPSFPQKGTEVFFFFYAGKIQSKIWSLFNYRQFCTKRPSDRKSDRFYQKQCNHGSGLGLGVTGTLQKQLTILEFLSLQSFSYVGRERVAVSVDNLSFA